MKLNYSINILPPHRSGYNFLAVAAMFLHANIPLYFNFEREGLCSQALHMRVNIHFGLLWWKKSLSRRDGIPHMQKRDLSSEKQPA